MSPVTSLSRRILPTYLTVKPFEGMTVGNKPNQIPALQLYLTASRTFCATASPTIDKHLPQLPARHLSTGASHTLRLEDI